MHNSYGKTEKCWKSIAPSLRAISLQYRKAMIRNSFRFEPPSNPPEPGTGEKEDKEDRRMERNTRRQKEYRKEKTEKARKEV